MATKTTSDRLILASTEALMRARPNSDQVEDAVIAVANDTSRPTRVRSEVIVSSANPQVGSKIVDNVVSLVNTSQDKQVRDAAIVAATRIGSKAITRVDSRLNSIALDPTESLTSHQVVHQALSKAQQ